MQLNEPWGEFSLGQERLDLVKLDLMLNCDDVPKCVQKQGGFISVEEYLLKCLAY